MRSHEPLARWTTLRLGGPAERFLEVDTRADLYDAVARADATGEELLVIGGGSNLVVADEGFAGAVVRAASSGVVVDDHAAGSVSITVEAGEDWERLAARAVAEGWSGLEALSGIPGSVGAVPIQNVGAYGQEVSDTIVAVHVFDRSDKQAATLSAAQCDFGYRTSVFKRAPGRYVVGAVTFRLARSVDGAPVRYGELARQLGVAAGERAPAGEVRDAVLRLRRAKGMVLADDDHDTWSVGSFFTNPIVPAADLPAGAPSFSQPDGRVKTSAAWLIEHAGLERGYGGEHVSLSTKHPLALTNRGGATTAELLALARDVRDRVQQASGIRLDPEPTLVNCAL